MTDIIHSVHVGKHWKPSCSNCKSLTGLQCNTAKCVTLLFSAAHQSGSYIAITHRWGFSPKKEQTCGCLPTHTQHRWLLTLTPLTHFGALPQKHWQGVCFLLSAAGRAQGRSQVCHGLTGRPWLLGRASLVVWPLSAVLAWVKQEHT